jgi:hypothetical protein
MIDDKLLWNLMTYLKDGTYDNSEIDYVIRLVADNEKQVSINFFKNTLDQVCFEKDDYLRLREMMIDWYASLRTIITIQKNAHDVFSQTNFQLDELFKSFGYNPAIDIIPLSSKASFFLDLVNFYKVKGTPNTIANVLEYYGFSDININEYWLLKNNLNQLVFRSEKAIASSNYDELIENDHDITYSDMTSDDPHWYYTQTQIENLCVTNLIKLPSKSPYFSLTSNFYINRISAAMALMSKVVRDEYERYSNNLPLYKNLLIKNSGIFASLLEVYVATVYSFIKIYGAGNVHSNSLLNLFSYNLPLEYDISTYNDNIPIPINLDIIHKSYLDEILVPPISRLDQKTRIEYLKTIWEYPTTLHFLQNEIDAENILSVLSPEIKEYCDLKISISEENSLLYSLISTLDNWIKIYISTDVPSIIIFILGFNYDTEINKIIDFFKPYRARLAFIDEIYVFKDRLHESIVEEDLMCQNIYENIFEFPTPYINGSSNFDEGRLFDCGIADDKLFTFIKTSYFEKLRSTDNFDEGNNFDSHYIFDSYSLFFVENINEIVNVSDSFNFIDTFYYHELRNFDEGGSFDHDIVKDNLNISVKFYYTEFMRCDGILDTPNNNFDSFNIYENININFYQIIKTHIILNETLNKNETYYFYDYPNCNIIEYENYNFDENFNFDNMICDDKTKIIIKNYISDDIKLNQSFGEDYNNISELVNFIDNNKINDSITFSDNCVITII